MYEIEFIRYLVNDYRKAEETEGWDEFQEIHGDAEKLCDTLIDIIEQRILKGNNERTKTDI